MYDDEIIVTTSIESLPDFAVTTSETYTTTTQTFYINDTDIIQKADSILNFLHIITYLLCVVIIACIVNWLWKQFKSLLGTY